jgi:AcrR family transcriptional regulator
MSNATTRRRPGRPKGGQIVADRGQLLAAAAEVIRTHGPDATMDDIAAGASVTKPILYRTIGDKAALVSALADSLVDELDRTVGAASRTASGPRSSFEAAIRSYLVAVDAERNLYLFVNSAAPGSDEFRRLVDRSAATMITTFTSARERAGLDVDGASAWAWAVVGALQFVATMWLRDDERDVDALAHDLSELLWSGVGQVLDRPRSARDGAPGA